MNTELNFKVMNPYTQKEYYQYQQSSPEQIQQAIKLILSGKKTAKAIPIYRKVEILTKLAKLIEQNKEAMSLNITREIGKTITESRLEVDRAIQTTILSAEAARQIRGEFYPPQLFNESQHRSVMVERRPYGAILAITPFNFPLNLAIHKIAPAFASGNSCLFKPNPQNYQTAKMLVDLCYQAGIPQDCLQLIVPQDQAMSAVVTAPEIDLISFTGGLLTAKKILQTAGLKKFVFELGGIDPIVVFPDCDLEKAAEIVMTNRFYTAGQRCNSCKVAYIHQSVLEQFKKILFEKIKHLQFDDPEKDSTKLSVVMNNNVAKMLISQIDSAKEQGAIVTHFSNISENKIPPVIIENLPSEHFFLNEEAFGPVLPLLSFNSIDDVIKDINKRPYGLQAGLFTNNREIIERFNRELETGSLIINDGPNLRYDYAPFGGIKNSGVGREGPASSINEFTYLHSLYY